MKPKKKSKHDLPSLDFMTALSVEECRERLMIMNRVFDSSRQIDMEDDGHFYVDWLFRYSWNRTESKIANVIDLERYFAHLVRCRISYWGNLSETEHGTRVQLIPSMQALQYVGRRASLVGPLNTIGIVVYAALLIGGGCSRNAFDNPFPYFFSFPVLLLVLLSLMVFGPLVYFTNVQLKLTHRTRRETEQVYEALHVSDDAVGIYEAQQAVDVPHAYPPNMKWSG